MVVGHEDARGLYGKLTSICVPRPGAETRWNVPPMRSPRSRMLISPKRPPFSCRSSWKPEPLSSM
jgi:hypothetical protein